MSDWDFLHEMHARGCSPEEIADAAAVGYAPWEEAYLSREWIDAELEDEAPDSSRSLNPREQLRSRDGFPHSITEQAEILEALVDCAERHFRNTGRTCRFGASSERSTQRLSLGSAAMGRITRGQTAASLASSLR